MCSRARPRAGGPRMLWVLHPQQRSFDAHVELHWPPQPCGKHHGHRCSCKVSPSPFLLTSSSCSLHPCECAQDFRGSPASHSCKALRRTHVCVNDRVPTGTTCCVRTYIHTARLALSIAWPGRWLWRDRYCKVTKKCKETRPCLGDPGTWRVRHTRIVCLGFGVQAEFCVHTRLWGARGAIESC